MLHTQTFVSTSEDMLRTTTKSGCHATSSRPVPPSLLTDRSRLLPLGGAPRSAAADAPTTPVPPEVPGVASPAEGDPVAPPAAPAAAPPPGSGWQPGGTGWREARRAERDARRATHRVWRVERREQRPGGGAILLGVLLILGGVYLLARDYLPALRLNLAWPVVLVGIGVLLVFRSIDMGGGGSSPSDSPPKP